MSLQYASVLASLRTFYPTRGSVMFDSFWRPVDELWLRRYSPPARWMPWGVFVGSFLVLACWAPTGLSNGDAAVYAQQIANRDFASRSVHLGFYVISATALGFSSSFADLTFNLLCCAFGAGCATLLFLLVRGWSGSTSAAWVGAAVLLANYTFVRNAVMAEVYAAQTAFLLLAMWLWLRDSPVAGGAAFAAAVLITPSSLFFGPAFILVRCNLRRLVLFGLVSTGMLIAAVFPVWQDYFLGDRGLLKATAGGLSLTTALVKDGFEVAFGFFALLPLLLLGLMQGIRRQALVPWLAAVAVVGGLTFILGERFQDVPVQLPTYALLASFAALGWQSFSRDLETQPRNQRMVWILGYALVAAVPILLMFFARSRVRTFGELPSELPWGQLAALGASAMVAAWWARGGRPQHAAWLLLAVGLGINVTLWASLLADRVQRIDGYHGSVMALGEQADANFVAVGTWDRGILMEHYLFRDSYTDHWINLAWLAGVWGDETRDKAVQQLETALSEGRDLWLLSDAPAVEARATELGYRIVEAADGLRRGQHHGEHQGEARYQYQESPEGRP